MSGARTGGRGAEPRLSVEEAELEIVLFLRERSGIVGLLKAGQDASSAFHIAVHYLKEQLLEPAS